MKVACISTRSDVLPLAPAAIPKFQQIEWIECPDVYLALPRIHAAHPEIVIIDLDWLTDVEIEVVGLLRKRYPRLLILVRASLEAKERVARAIAEGASGELGEDLTPRNPAVPGVWPGVPSVASSISPDKSENSFATPGNVFDASLEAEEASANQSTDNSEFDPESSEGVNSEETAAANDGSSESARPPVPWNPGPPSARRKPPVSRGSGASLLTPEELEALLGDEPPPPNGPEV